MILPTITNYIKKIQDENELLKQRLITEKQKLNLIILNLKIKNEKLIKENILLRQHNIYLSLKK